MSYRDRNGTMAARADLCVEAISGDKPPMAAADMAALLSIRRGAFDRTLNVLRLPTAKRIYIAGYRRPNSGHGGGSWIPLFKAGNLPDMPVPRPTAEEERARRLNNSRQQNKRKREREQDKINTEKYQPALDPFSLALFGRLPELAECQ